MRFCPRHCCAGIASWIGLNWTSRTGMERWPCKSWQFWPSKATIVVIIVIKNWNCAQTSTFGSSGSKVLGNQISSSRGWIGIGEFWKHEWVKMVKVSLKWHCSVNGTMPPREMCPNRSWSLVLEKGGCWPWHQIVCLWFLVPKCPSKLHTILNPPAMCLACTPNGEQDGMSLQCSTNCVSVSTSKRHSVPHLF